MSTLVDTAVLAADPEQETAAAPVDAAEAVRRNVEAFRADDNASMMGGWTN